MPSITNPPPSNLNPGSITLHNSCPFDVWHTRATTSVPLYPATAALTLARDKLAAGFAVVVPLAERPNEVVHWKISREYREPTGMVSAPTTNTTGPLWAGYLEGMGESVLQLDYSWEVRDQKMWWDVSGLNTHKIIPNHERERDEEMLEWRLKHKPMYVYGQDESVIVLPVPVPELPQEKCTPLLCGPWQGMCWNVTSVEGSPFGRQMMSEETRRVCPDNVGVMVELCGGMSASPLREEEDESVTKVVRKRSGAAGHGVVSWTVVALAAFAAAVVGLS